MRWERKYPHVKLDEETEHGLWHSPVISKCFMCDSRTSWVDLCFEAPLCSEECEKEAYNDIAKRTQQDAEDRYRPSF